MLLTAIEVASVNPKPLVNAMYWLESACLLEEGKAPTALLKNAGLAHVHMIQNKVLTPSDDITEFIGPDFLRTKARLNLPIDNVK